MCTAVRFTDGKGNLYFGRNMDWSFDYGETLVITPRNHAANSGHQAIIGMGIVFNNYPLYFDCVNESGLAVAGLSFSGYTSYPTEAVPGTTAVASYAFPYWVCSNFSTVDEVEAALHEVAIVGEGVGNYPASPLHWMIADVTGSLVVECTPDGLHVYRNPVDVLSNQPEFPWHLENLRNYMNVVPEINSAKWGSAELKAYGAGACMRGLPGDTYSPSRFVRAAYLNAHRAPEEGERANVASLFHVLGGTAMVKGSAQMLDGSNEYTLYTSGYSAAEKRYYYNTYEEPAYVTASLNDFDLDGTDVISL